MNAWRKKSNYHNLSDDFQQFCCLLFASFIYCVCIHANLGVHFATINHKPSAKKPRLKQRKRIVLWFYLFIIMLHEFCSLGLFFFYRSLFRKISSTFVHQGVIVYMQTWQRIFAKNTRVYYDHHLFLSEECSTQSFAEKLLKNGFFAEILLLIWFDFIFFRNFHYYKLVYQNLVSSLNCVRLTDCCNYAQSVIIIMNDLWFTSFFTRSNYM